MNIIFQINGGIGKCVLATSVFPGIKETFPDSKLIVMSGYPEVFLNNPLAVKAKPEGYDEERFYAIGRTDSNRFLFVVFTVRADRVRIISARDANKKEKVVYNEKTK